MKSISQSPPSTIPDRGAMSEVQAGASAPLGASVTADGVNFSVFSKRATGIDLLLFEHVDDEKPASVIHVHPASNRTYHYWHVFAPALKAGQIYGYRVTVRLNRQRASVSTRPRSFWTHMDAPSWFPPDTTGRQHTRRATMSQPP